MILTRACQPFVVCSVLRSEQSLVRSVQCIVCSLYIVGVGERDLGSRK